MKICLRARSAEEKTNKGAERPCDRGENEDLLKGAERRRNTWTLKGAVHPSDRAENGGLRAWSAEAIIES